MIGSGKQILNKTIAEMSTRRIPGKDLDGASERIRAALLYHGSTSEDTFRLVNSLCWASKSDSEEVARQGLSLCNKNLPIADFYSQMLKMPGLQDFILQSVPGLSSSDYAAATWAIWAIVSSKQMYTELLPIEIDPSKIDLEEAIENMKEKMQYFNSSEKDQQ